MGKFHNVKKDTEVVGYSPDCVGDYYDYEDFENDHNYMQEKICQVFKNMSTDETLDCYILYGGEITDGGSGTVDISKGAALSKDSSGEVKYTEIPALTGVSLPSGWNDNRQIWVTLEYESKLGSDTRNHAKTSTSWHYNLNDSYTGESSSDDLFVDSDPNSTPDTIICLGSFQMNGTTYAEVADERSPVFNFSANMLTSSLQSGLLKNPFINGCMRFAQRGTSFVSPVTGTYTLDRWEYTKAGAMTHTIQHSLHHPSGDSATTTRSILLSCTTIDASLAATDNAHIRQFIEGYNFLPFYDQTATLSFWVKATKTGIYCVSFRNDGADRSYVIEYTVNESDTWEYKTVTLTFDEHGGTWDYENGTGIRVSWALAAGSTFHTTADAWQTGNYMATSNQVNACDSTSNHFRITEVQMNLGTEALPFETRPYGVEKELCERYFEKSYNYDEVPGTVTGDGASWAYVNGNKIFPASLPELLTKFRTSKRDNPTIKWYSPSTGTVDKVRVNSGDQTVSTTLYSNEISVGYPAITAGVTDGDILAAHWTADAEI